MIYKLKIMQVNLLENIGVGEIFSQMQLAFRFSKMPLIIVTILNIIYDID